MPNERSPKSEVEVLRDKVAWLEDTIRRLSEERDKALKAKETMITQVLPMAAARDKPAMSGRSISMVLLVVLLVAIIGLAVYMPRMTRKSSVQPKLPPGVELRQDEEAGYGEEAGEEEEAYE